MYLFHKNTHLPGSIAALLFLTLFATAQNPVITKSYTTVVCGAQQFELYVPSLKNKRVGLVTNITGLVNGVSTADTLLALQVNLKKIFGPEHGFRSDTEAGEKVKNKRDVKTGLPVISLYGANKKPGKELLKDLDVIIYDIQDIGVRFYTYISTLCYVMEACAENGKEFIVLDRPNPNGFYIDGPVLQEAYTSFLGLHPVPLVYGMTCGEYAKMANGEGWLKNKVKCQLRVIPLGSYDRDAAYSLPEKPSPNIPNAGAVALYPSLGLFEGTIISLGRGTAFPFQVVGHPAYDDSSFSFTPRPGPLSKEPKYVNQRCFGIDLRQSAYLRHHPHTLDLSWIIMLYAHLKREDFFDENFNYHAGNGELQKQLKAELPEAEIRKSWAAGIEKFKLIRKKYLLYPDFKE